MLFPLFSLSSFHPSQLPFPFPPTASILSALPSHILLSISSIPIHVPSLLFPPLISSLPSPSFPTYFFPLHSIFSILTSPFTSLISSSFPLLLSLPLHLLYFTIAFSIPPYLFLSISLHSQYPSSTPIHLPPPLPSHLFLSIPRPHLIYSYSLPFPRPISSILIHFPSLAPSHLFLFISLPSPHLIYSYSFPFPRPISSIPIYFLFLAPSHLSSFIGHPHYLLRTRGRKTDTYCTQMSALFRTIQMVQEDTDRPTDRQTDKQTDTINRAHVKYIKSVKQIAFRVPK